MDKLGFIREELSPDEEALEMYAELLVSIDDDIHLAMEAVGLNDDCDDYDEDDIALELEDDDDECEDDDDCDDDECDFEDADEGIRDAAAGLRMKVKEKLRRNKLKHNGTPDPDERAIEAQIMFENQMQSLLESAKALNDCDDDDEIDSRIINEGIDFEDDDDDDESDQMANDIIDSELAEEAAMIAALEEEDNMCSTLEDVMEAACGALDRIF